ncbi:hypothetical protein ACJX0J_017767 [Zea mays]
MRWIPATRAVDLSVMDVGVSNLFANINKECLGIWFDKSLHLKWDRGSNCNGGPPAWTLVDFPWDKFGMPNNFWEYLADFLEHAKQFLASTFLVYKKCFALNLNVIIMSHDIMDIPCNGYSIIHDIVLLYLTTEQNMFITWKQRSAHVSIHNTIFEQLDERHESLGV